ncbi:MAG: glycosyltransferase family 4 protein [Candidatus Sumerlaeaceae bacterium]|nr:glycosyltransferase family 4 protein [Candidatus Sumerlaeaceae bacterium]
MLIAFFTNNYKPFIGGVPIAVENTAKALRRRGHRVLIFAPDYDGAEDEEDVFRVLSIKNFNDTPFSLPLPMTVRPAYDLDALSGVDIVHVHHPFLLGMSGLQLARAYDAPVVFTYHTQYEKYIHYLPFPEKMTAELAVRLATRFSNSCDAVIAPSSDIKKVLVERGVEVPIFVIPTGVDLRRFRGGDSTYLQRLIGVSVETPLILTVSRLAKEKNIGFLIEAFSRLCAYERSAHMVLVGDGDYRSQLEKLAIERGIAERTHFVGALSGRNLVSAYKSAKVFVFASQTETQGMVVLEAMANGLPVVAVDAPGVRDFVQHASNGYLVDDQGVDDFAERIKLLLTTPQLYETLREQARKTARKWSLAVGARKLETVYRQLKRDATARGRRERFIMLREIVRYHFAKLVEELEKLV